MRDTRRNDHRRRAGADGEHAGRAHEGGHGGGRAAPARLRARGQPDAGGMDQGHRVHDQGRPGLHAGPPGIHPAVGHDGPLRAGQHHARQDQDGGGDQRQPARPLLPREHAEVRDAARRSPRRRRRRRSRPVRPHHQRPGRADPQRPGDGVADGRRRPLRHPERHRGDRLPRHLPAPTTRATTSSARCGRSATSSRWTARSGRWSWRRSGTACGPRTSTS